MIKIDVPWWVVVPCLFSLILDALSTGLELATRINAGQLFQ